MGSACRVVHLGGVHDGLRRPRPGVVAPPCTGRSDQPSVASSDVTGDPLGAFRRAGSALAICAHPDDDSCGLGAVLALAASLGKHVGLLTFTRGEAGITPAWRGTREELAARREGELGRAAEILGIHRRVVLEDPDGLLAETDAEALDDEGLQIVRRWRPGVVLAYDPLGVTCHPDHVAIGRSVLRVWRATPHPPALLFWTIPNEVAAAMQQVLSDRYAGRPAAELVPVDVGPFRERQRWAVEAHASPLGRAERGTFGRCEGCRRPISVERLRALPRARSCLRCQRREDARTRRRHPGARRSAA